LKQALAAPVRAELEIQEAASPQRRRRRSDSPPSRAALRRAASSCASRACGKLRSRAAASAPSSRPRRDALEANFGVSELEAEFEQKRRALRESLARDARVGGASRRGALARHLAKDALESELLDELEAAAASLPRGDSRDLAGFDAHWRTWAHLRRGLATDFVDVLPDRRGVLYDAVGTEIFNYGAWLTIAATRYSSRTTCFASSCRSLSREAEDHATLRNNLKIRARLSESARTRQELSTA
jgi:hypothetical protein